MLWGGIAGDIIGSRFEFFDSKKRQGEDIPYDFELFAEGCQFTDDTVLTVALANSFLKEEGWVKNAKNFALKYPTAGYGGMFVKWVQGISERPYNSYGNGSAMRVGAVGYASDNWDECMENAKKSAEITHNHPEGIKGAQAAAGAIYMAKTGATKEQIKSKIEKEFKYDLKRSYADIKKRYGFKVSCQESVPESIVCFLESKSWEDTVRKTVCLKGDTDTMACIAGNIAEAFYGKVSKDVIEKTKKYLTEEFIQIVEDFNDKYKSQEGFD
jgi:ADP-ribosylglycohydrolase